MPNTPIILSDNFFDDVVLHPDHIVAQDGTEVEGTEIFCIADNLRDLTHYSPAETNAQRIIQVNCLSAKQASMVVLDRGHNLAGKTIQIDSSPNGSAWTNRVNATIPATASGLPTDVNGCSTSDAVWWKTFTPVSAAFWRLVIPALGVGITPIVTGLYLGDLYRFPEYLDSPGAYDYRNKYTALKNDMSQRGVRVKRRIINQAAIDIKISDWEEAEFLTFYTQAARLMFQNHPWWFCLEDTVFTSGSDLLRLYQLPGDMVFDPAANPVHRDASFSLEEVIPSSTL